ncbi:MAG: ArsR family transcriptional regulator [Sandaracinaceae bacterium]
MIARAIDNPVGPESAADAAYGAAALACVGRLDDAAAQLHAVRGASAPAAMATARFFLCVARLRAGSVDRARALALDIVADARRTRDPMVSFYAWQALACLRYFGGGLSRCAELARRALDAAFRARSAYGRVLATDLRAHAFIHLGRVHAGIELLRRARSLADASGFSGHLAAIDHSLAVYETRFGYLTTEEAVARVEALGALDCQDSYSARNASIELSILLVFSGRGGEAWDLLRRVSQTFVPEGDHRLRVRFLCAAAIVSALRDGRKAARRYVDEAEAELEHAPDRALAVEVTCARAWVASDDEREDIVAALLRAYRESGGVARALVHARALSPDAPVPSSTRLTGFEEDRVGALIASLRERDGPLKLLAEGYLGLYPRSQGLEPGLRIHFLGGSDVLLEELGDLRTIQISDRLGALLVALSRGERSKEQLLGEVWGISRYDGERHDAVVHTALSRLRALLGAGRLGVEAGAHGYRLADGIEVLGSAVLGSAVLGSAAIGGEALGSEAPSADAVAASDGVAVAQPPTVVDADAPRSGARDQRILHLLADAPASARELAASLGVSEMTVLRELRKMLERGDVERTGHGRATRYARRVSESSVFRREDL